MGKQERAMKREAAEPTARMVALYMQPGQGWCWAVCDVPESVVVKYATKIGGPEILPIVLARATEALESHAAQGVVKVG